MDLVFVNRVTKKDIFAHLEALYGNRFKKYRADWESTCKGTYLPEFPLCLNYEFVDGCNLKCKHCIRSSEIKSRGRLGWDLFKQTIDEGSVYGLPSLKVGFGEPFVEKNIFEMIDYAKSKGVMDIIVTTNGTFIKSENIKAILKSGITFLRVSIDAADPKTYKEIRGGDLHELEETIKELVKKRAESKMVSPMIRSSFVVMEENKDQVDEFKKRWIDKIDFIDFQKYIDPKYLTEDINLKKFQSSFFCPYPWQMVPIMANGDIRACCSWYGENLIIGNIKENSIKEAWDGNFMKELREQIKRGVYTNDCAKCVYARDK